MYRLEQQLNSIDRLIGDLQGAKSHSERIALITNMSILLADANHYHYFAESGYGRNLIFSCAEFEVILLCWQPGQTSRAHDHNGSLCVMKCLSGVLDEHRYAKLTGTATGLYPIGQAQITAGSTAHITDEQGLHRLGNGSQVDACSLHFYFPPIHNTNVYCLEKGQQKQIKSVFTSEYGIKKRSDLLD